MVSLKKKDSGENSVDGIEKESASAPKKAKIKMSILKKNDASSPAKEDSLTPVDKKNAKVTADAEVVDLKKTTKPAVAKKRASAKSKLVGTKEASPKGKSPSQEKKTAAKKTATKTKAAKKSSEPKKTKVAARKLNMNTCYRCTEPFEKLENEFLCPKCEGPAADRWGQLFGDEDPYSPQPTIRTNKIARIIPRKAHPEDRLV